MNVQSAAVLVVRPVARTPRGGYGRVRRLTETYVRLHTADPAHSMSSRIFRRISSFLISESNPLASGYGTRRLSITDKDVFETYNESTLFSKTYGPL